MEGAEGVGIWEGQLSWKWERLGSIREALTKLEFGKGS